MPYWRLSTFYLFFFASLGALLPYWALYLDSLGFSSADIGELMARFLGPDVQHRIDLLEEIPLGPGEKFRASISRVFSNYGGDA